MKNYYEMSDFEINKAVAEKLGMDVSGATEENNMMYDYVPDICNNIVDAWPIIFENRITVNPYDNPSEGWFATYDTSFFIDSENPLRAAMIVYLMMKDEEQ